MGRKVKEFLNCIVEQSRGPRVERVTTTDIRPSRRAERRTLLAELSKTVSEGLQSTVGRKYAFTTIACGSLLALLITLVQLTVDFKVAQKTQRASIADIQNSFLPSLTESVWVLDRVLIETQMSGIAQIDGVNRVEVIADAGQFSFAKGPPSTTGYQVEMPLVRRYEGRSDSLGTLIIHADHDDIWSQVLFRGAVMFMTNFLKTVCVAFVLLFLFQWLIGRHLLRLVEFANSYDPSVSGQRLALDQNSFLGRPVQTKEFTSLEKSINKWSQTTETYLAQLRQTNQEQAEFSYAISHDLKSPTNTMAMLLEELEEPDLEPDDVKGIIDDIRLTNRRMRALVNDVLNYSSLVDLNLDQENVRLSELIEETKADLAEDIAAANATFADEELPSVTAQPNQLRILLQNLISNAIKFRHKDKGVVIRISGHQTPDLTELRIADNGIGIPQKYRERVFGLFSKLQTRSEYEGTGLGLAICRRVMSNHGGTISIGDGIDGGTEFTLHFPRRSYD